VPDINNIAHALSIFIAIQPHPSFLRPNSMPLFEVAGEEVAAMVVAD
jgi:hypothetical protein